MPFIDEIHIENHYRVEKFDLDLPGVLGDGEAVRPHHVIFTGVNGSAKTTILEKIADELTYTVSGRSTAQSSEQLEQQVKQYRAALANPSYTETQRRQYKLAIQQLEARLGSFAYRATLGWSDGVLVPGEIKAVFDRGRFMAAYLPVPRPLASSAIVGPRNIAHTPKQPRESVRQHLAQYLVNLHVQARLAEAADERRAIEGWIARIEGSLREIFGVPELRLIFDRRDFSLRFAEGGIEYGFDQLPAGFMSVLAIVGEILLRSGEAEEVAHTLLSDEMSGVVLIDELGAHLHPSMQERVLPALTGFFPRFQFIVATHSPAIICSVDNAVVVDLPSGEAITSRELRGTTYGRLLTEHFRISSDFDLKSTRQLERLTELVDTPDRSDAEQAEVERLADELVGTSHPLALAARGGGPHVASRRNFRR